MNRLISLASWIIILLISCKNDNSVHSQKITNKLINESSPYLLQHAYNPVDWHPWGEEALEKAKKENKLLIVSIGYAACHWCHVMEHESFEDSLVAAVMNEHFVPIKVDREERPDVDDIYMSAAQLVSGQGGWPLNAFSLPDGRPVWAGTYFPKAQWLNILKQFADLKNNDYPRLEKSANQLVSGIKSMDAIAPASEQEYKLSDVEDLATAFVKQIDQLDGGRRGAPKFPLPNNYDYLLKYATMQEDHSAMEAVAITLDKMAMGGIYDQIGGGFARYSVDAQWFAPHFEKMLYDNGQLVSLYSDAYRLSKKPLYRHTIEQTLEFIERELTDANGRFYSSLDADSEGEEGKFYVWTSDDIDQVLTDPIQNQIVRDYYNIEEKGNWEHNNNILHISGNLSAISKRHDKSVEELEAIIDNANKALLDARSLRIRPGLDDKILTSWNALMIKGYVDAFKALGDDQYLAVAINAMNRLIDDQQDEDGRLNRNFKDGKSSINAFLDDYAITIQALLALYEVTFDQNWLEKAKLTTDYTIEHFSSTDSDMLYYTSDQDPPLIARKTELADNVISGSNSIMARNLYRLGEFMYVEDYISKAKRMLSSIWPNIEASRQPSYYANWLQLQIDQVSPPYEVAIVGDNAQAVALEMMQTYHPNVVYLGDTKESDLPLLKYKYVEDETMIYVCQNKTCKLPVTDIKSALELIEGR